MFSLVLINSKREFSLFTFCCFIVRDEKVLKGYSHNLKWETNIQKWRKISSLYINEQVWYKVIHYSSNNLADN
jgi:hypothetical protein